MAKFIPGLELSERFYAEAVGPILKKHWPKLNYSAGLIGDGSEVQGFDTPMSMDHHWGPRALVFLSHEDHRRVGSKVHETLANELPYTFAGYCTNMPQGFDSRYPKPIQAGPIDHFVEFFSYKTYFQNKLGIDPDAKIDTSQWLTFSEQALLEVTGGKVFVDGLGKLNTLRRKLSYYPKDVWLYILASQWESIGQEEHLIGRAGMVGDELGSRVIAARHVRDLMRLCFLMSRKYAPYAKWFGTAFNQLNCAAALSPQFTKVLQAGSWRTRQKHMIGVYESLLRMHNSLGITKPLPVRTSPFHSRPFIVSNGDVIADKIRKKIRSKDIRAIKTAIGSVDQYSDSSDLLENTRLRKKLRLLYD